LFTIGSSEESIKMTVGSGSPSYDPDNFNFTKDVVDYWASPVGGDPIAMVWNPPGEQGPDSAKSLRFSHFSRRARQVVRGLRRQGINKGDVILLSSSKTAEWYEILCGAILVGIPICLCSSALVSLELEQRALKARAKVFVGDSAQVSKMIALRKEGHKSTIQSIIQIDCEEQLCDPCVLAYSSLLEENNVGPDGENEFHTEVNETCLLYFTSGTTGDAKLVKHTHVSYPYGKLSVHLVGIQLHLI
jgi:acyl-coenzyme A synthetase/AMP-(fatty) acid ligase